MSPLTATDVQASWTDGQFTLDRVDADTYLLTGPDGDRDNPLPFLQSCGVPDDWDCEFGGNGRVLHTWISRPRAGG